MNKKYVYRELVLHHNFGFDLDSKIEKLYFYLKSEIDSTEKYITKNNTDSIYYRRNGNVLMSYNLNSRNMALSKKSIWEILLGSYNIHTTEDRDILSAIIEYIIKDSVNLVGGYLVNFNNSWKKIEHWEKVD